MPFQKKHKRKNYQNRVNLRKQKIAIKKRLIEISIRVDGYIYRNKPITVEEAEKYLAEISIHQTRCNNDVHILQVIEKLTRLMKTIIEETKKRLPLTQNVATSINDQSIDLLPSFTNKHEDSYVILYDGNLRETIDVVNKTKGQDSDSEIIVIISDSEDEDKGDEYNSQLTDKFQSASLNTRKKVNIKEVDNLNYLTTQHAQSNNSNIEKNKHLNPVESYFGKIADKTKEIVNNNCNLIVTKSKTTRQYKNKNKKTLENALQTTIQPMSQLETKNTKMSSSGVTQKSLPCGETLNTTVNTNPPKRLIMASKKNKNRVPKKKTNKDLPDTMNKPKKASKKNNNIINNNNLISSNFKHNTSPLLIAPLIRAPIKNKHKHIDISDEVSLPVPRTSNDAVSYTISNQDSIANKMSALTIYNDKAINDLSWVEGIRYVREINADEFDPIPSRINETFWNDLTLPHEWKDIDFL